MFKSKLTLFLLLISSMVGICYAQPSDSWLSATADSRVAAQNIQKQIANQQLQQQNNQQQQLQKLQETLEGLRLQQKALMQNTQQPATTSTLFETKPAQSKGTTNPWLKPNPWQNSEKNPFPGHQYAPNTVPSQNTEPTSSPSNIYVNPNSIGGQTNQQQQRPTNINIFK